MTSAVLPLIVVFVICNGSSFWMPPPVPALEPVAELLLMTSFLKVPPSEPSAQRPPPSPLVVELPEMIESEITGRPLKLAMPPPPQVLEPWLLAWLPEIVLPTTVSVLSLSIAPPQPE